MFLACSADPSVLASLFLNAKDQFCSSRFYFFIYQNLPAVKLYNTKRRLTCTVSKQMHFVCAEFTLKVYNLCKSGNSSPYHIHLPAFIGTIGNQHISFPDSSCTSGAHLLWEQSHLASYAGKDETAVPLGHNEDFRQSEWSSRGSYFSLLRWEIYPTLS